MSKAHHRRKEYRTSEALPLGSALIQKTNPLAVQRSGFALQAPGLRIELLFQR
jgi:hypothetical protein